MLGNLCVPGTKTMTAQAFESLTRGRVRPETLDRIGHEVALVEEELARRLDSGVATVDRVGHLTLLAGGKRLRPAFVALAAGATGLPFGVVNPAVPANTITIYAGGRPVAGAATAFGGYGGYEVAGSQTWLDAVGRRGPGFTLWGGALTFDSETNWYTGPADGIGRDQIDLYSVATHELGHVLGIGTAPGWGNQTRSGTFVGPTAVSVYGGPVPVSADGAHWADGVAVGGQPASLDPYARAGTRSGFTRLDYAALRDVGWTVSGVSGVSGAGPAPPPITPVPLGSPLLVADPDPHGSGTGCSCAGCRLAVLTGSPDGSARVFTAGADGKLVAAGDPVVPFPGFAGVVRGTAADFDGDGTADFAFTTGAGPAAAVRIVSGATGADLVAAAEVLGGFAGGAFLAVGDVDGDGRAELAVSADAGGGTRVQVFRVAGGGLVPVIDFLAFGDANFRGGSRVALADIDRDGAADLIVGAGVGGAPRMAIYSGTGLAAGRADRLVPDFFALDSSLRSGVYVTAADFDGDGFADIAYSTGNTGGPRVRVVSGAVLVANPGADVATLPAVADFFALDAADRRGIRIAARDLDGDGKAELVVASGDKATATVRVIPYGQMSVPTTSLQNPFADPATIDGVYVG